MSENLVGHVVTVSYQSKGMRIVSITCIKRVLMQNSLDCTHLSSVPAKAQVPPFIAGPVLSKAKEWKRRERGTGEENTSAILT